MTTSPSALNGLEPSSGRLDAFYHACIAGLLLTFGALLVWRPLYPSLDFWAHAAVGRWTWQTGHIPDRTLFLWTADEPWVYHHWLTQVLFYGLTNIGGPHGLLYVVLGFTAVMVLLPFSLVWLVWRRGGRLSSWMVVPFVLALKGTALRFEARPELFTELCLCLLLTFLVAWSGAPGAPYADRINGRDKLRLVSIPFLFMLWANLHGAVIIGVMVLAVTAGCDLVQDRFSLRSRVLAFFALLAPAAVCVNPYGVSYWQALRGVTSYTFAHILEWLPIWVAPPLPAEWVIGAVALFTLAIGAWAMNPNRRWAHLGWLLLLGALFAQARRNVWPFILTCLMVLAVNAQALDAESLWRKVSQFSWYRSNPRARSLPTRLRWPVRTGLVAWLVLECLFLVLSLLGPGRPLLPTSLDRGVVRFILEHQLEGRVFNDYYNASYLQWRLAGRPALYVDALNAYSDNVMRDYHDIKGVSKRGRQLLDEQQIGIVVLTIEHASVPLLAPLANYLDADSRWVRVYASKDGVIWVRRTLEYEHVWGPLLGSVTHAKFALLEQSGDGD